ncbi:putative nucleolysin TIAR-like protein [Tanacetum coccineum]
MSYKKRRPVIVELITPGFKSRVLEANFSPNTPLEFQVLSPTGVINRDMGGIGLGIVAALEHIPTKKSDPIPVSQSRSDGDLETVDSFEEEYTIVTFNKPNKSFTRVYRSEKAKETREQGCIFSISPSRFCDDDMKVCQDSSFLSACHLCNKRLHGKDIYMYRGEMSFCSPECRSRQICMDEKPDKYCSSQASSNRTSRPMSTEIFVI